MRKEIRIAAGVLALGIFFLGLGWGTVQLGKLYIAVIGNHTNIADKPATPKDSGEKQLVKLPGFEVYYLQLGVFQDQENAGKLANELQLSGVKAVVLRGSPNKVVTGFFSQPTAAKAEHKLMQNVKPLEKGITVKGLTFKATPGDGQKLAVLLNKYAGLLAGTATICSVSQPTGLKDKELQDLYRLMQALQTDNQQIIPALTADKSRIPGKTVLTAMQKESSLYEHNLQQLLRDRNRENYTRLQESSLRLLDLYQEYRDLLQNRQVN